jgi:hypothetical protein
MRCSTAGIVTSDECNVPSELSRRAAAIETAQTGCSAIVDRVEGV